MHNRIKKLFEGKTFITFNNNKKWKYQLCLERGGGGGNKQDKIFAQAKFWTPKVGDILETYRIYICICCLPMPILKTAEFTK